MRQSYVRRKDGSEASYPPPPFDRTLWRAVALCVALLSASAADAQTQADAPTISSINFRTGAITFTPGSCGGSHTVESRYHTSGGWNFQTPTPAIASGDTFTPIADRDYVEVRMYRQGGTGCPSASNRTTALTYTAVTVASNRVTLGAANIHASQLTVTLGADHAFGSSVTPASFQLVTSPVVPELSISSVSATSGTRTATLTLRYTGETLNTFTLRTRVRAAAHNGAQDLSSLASADISVVPATDAINISSTRLAVNEGASASYTVELATQPSGEVAVAVTSDNADVTVGTTTLTFTAINWDSAQTVTATAAGDVGSADETATLTHSASGGGYAGITRGLIVTIQDDEQTGTDYDTDEDGLIEISSLAQLNAVRYDLNGDGTVAAGDATNYGNAFSSAATGMGCPDGSDSGDVPDACLGYELTQDLNFDTDGDGDVDGDDVGSFANFPPIGGSFSAAFHGNGHTISNLTMERSTQTAAMFGSLALGATVRGVGLINPNVRHTGSTSDRVGALASRNFGTIVGCYAIGGTVTVTQANRIVGGLVGRNSGVVHTSYSTVAVSTSGQASVGAGGLVGANNRAGSSPAGTIQNSYATGSVNASNFIGGLTGNNGLAGFSGAGNVITSYWDNTVVSSTGSVSASLGRSTTELQRPTEYGSTGIYSTWDDTYGDAWDFGTSTEYPVLKIDGHDPAVQRPGLHVAPTALTILQGDSASYTIRLHKQPSAAVTVEVGGAPAGVMIDQTTLTFTTINWATEQTVTVSVPSDQSDQTLALTHSATGGDYAGLSPIRLPSVSVVVGDGVPDADGGEPGGGEPGGGEADGGDGTPEAVVPEDEIGTLCTTELAQAAEGGTATAVAELTSEATVPTTISWRVVADADPATADADAGDHGDASGEVVVAVGERCAEIDIDILDDADAEPTREWFAVELALRFPGKSLNRRLVPVAVREGVCDRAPAVAEALLAATGLEGCDTPEASNLAGVQALGLAGAGLRALATSDLNELAGLRTLDLSNNGLDDLPSLASLPRLERLLLAGNALADVPQSLPSPERLLDLNLSANALSELPSDAFDGMSALRVLRLDGNQLAALPDGVFEGLSSLRFLRLDDNPGAPFALLVEVERTDADSWAPSPARLRVATPLGAPFDMTVGLAAQGGVFADGAATAETVVAAGELASRPHLSLSSATGFAQVSPTAPPLPSRLCLGQPCWRGFEFAIGEPLALFVRPLEVLSAPEPAPLFGDALRLPLASLVAAGDASASGELTWRASSSDESLAEVRIVNGELVVEAIAGAEGVVVVEATATDALGQTATARFEVQVDFHWRTSPTRGWRGAISPD